MLKGKFLFNEDLLANEASSSLPEEFDKHFKNNKKINFAELLNDTVWYEKYSVKELLEIIDVLDNMGLFKGIEIEGYEELQFEYENLKKKIFLLNLSEIWVTKKNIDLAVDSLTGIQSMENKFGKCVRFFNNQEIVNSIIDLWEDREYYKLRSRLDVLSKYQKFYKEKRNPEDMWKTYAKASELRKILADTDIEEDILTKGDLLNLSDNLTNAQDSVIPLLIFEGVKFSKLEDEDELRHILAEDLIDGNKLVIRGKNERVIDLDNEVAQIVRDAINADYIITEKYGKQRYYEIQKTKYVVRRSITTSEEHLGEGVMRYRGVYSRIALCKDVFESLKYDIPFSPRSIEKFGKIHYVKKYIAEGNEVGDAIRLTLKRFGELKKGEDSKQKKENNHLSHQLRNYWEIYK